MYGNSDTMVCIVDRSTRKEGGKSAGAGLGLLRLIVRMWHGAVSFERRTACVSI
jgi:hypothetical protein